MGAVWVSFSQSLVLFRRNSRATRVMPKVEIWLQAKRQSSSELAWRCCRCDLHSAKRCLSCSRVTIGHWYSPLNNEEKTNGQYVGPRHARLPKAHAVSIDRDSLRLVNRVILNDVTAP